MRKDEFQIVEAYGKQMIKETLQELRAEIEAIPIPYEDYENEEYVAYDMAKSDMVDLIDRKISEVTE